MCMFVVAVVSSSRLTGFCVILLLSLHFGCFSVVYFVLRFHSFLVVCLVVFVFFFCYSGGFSSFWGSGDVPWEQVF